mmetsp:Transcript_74146/g.162295  ORF Transcript_74146/g.162295 Transcript_74146/m.162295 type:complete len:206 (-) Transcript_74146:24-641(-)
MFACCCTSQDEGSTVEVFQIPTLDEGGPSFLGGTLQPFTILLKRHRRGQPLGWHLDCVDPTSLYVYEVSSASNTPVGAYNLTAVPTQQLKVGCFIKSVNGLTSTDKMTEAVDKDDVLELVVQNPYMFELEVEKRGKSLGMELKFWESGCALMIGEIVDGAVKSSGARVKPKDRIVQVNGISGGNDTLLRQLKGNDRVKLTISRCP